MAKKGLKQENIFEAAVVLQRQGEEPSAKRIREHIGSGSLTTISKHLKQWQLQESQASKDELDLQAILKDVDYKVTSEFLSNEHPQIVALVISYLDPKQAASILNALPENLRNEALSRMENIGVTQKQFVQKVAKVIQEEFKTLPNYYGEQKGGVEFVDKVKKEMKQ